MDISSLNTLKSALAGAESWGGYSALTVVAGLVAEFAPLFIFSKEMRWTEKFMLAGATALIAAGCVGEYEFGERASQISAPLRADGEAKIRTLEAAATLAAQDMITAKKDTAIAQENASRAIEHAATLEIEVSKARKEAADAAAEEARLKARVLWRQITPAQCASIERAIGRTSGSLDVEYPTGDAEAQSFAISIFNCVTGFPGWTGAMSAATWANGLPLNVAVAGRPVPALEAVKLGLQQAGVQFWDPPPDSESGPSIRTLMTAGFGSAPVRLIVGSRPIF
jgi:hypothetical protein